MPERSGFCRNFEGSRRGQKGASRRSSCDERRGFGVLPACGAAFCAFESKTPVVDSALRSVRCWFISISSAGASRRYLAHSAWLMGTPGSLEAIGEPNQFLTSRSSHGQSNSQCARTRVRSSKRFLFLLRPSDLAERCRCIRTSLRLVAQTSPPPPLYRGTPGRKTGRRWQRGQHRRGLPGVQPATPSASQRPRANARTIPRTRALLDGEGALAPVCGGRDLGRIQSACSKPSLNRSSVTVRRKRNTPLPLPTPTT